MITAVMLSQLLRRTYIFYVTAFFLCVERHIEFSRHPKAERGKHWHSRFCFIEI